jgi:hypothetical protein
VCVCVCVKGGYNELASALFVSVKINGLGNFLEESKLYILTAFGHLKSCWEGYRFSDTHSEKPVELM